MFVSNKKWTQLAHSCNCKSFSTVQFDAASHICQCPCMRQCVCLWVSVVYVSICVCMGVTNANVLLDSTFVCPLDLCFYFSLFVIFFRFLVFGTFSSFHLSVPFRFLYFFLKLWNRFELNVLEAQTWTLLLFLLLFVIVSDVCLFICFGIWWSMAQNVRPFGMTDFNAIHTNIYTISLKYICVKPIVGECVRALSDCLGFVRSMDMERAYKFETLFTRRRTIRLDGLVLRPECQINKWLARRTTISYWIWISF